MTANKKVILVNTLNGDVVLTIYGENVDETIFEVSDAAENGEALYQIKEGCFYEYKISSGYYLENSEIVSQSKVNESSGRISPNIYVGLLLINIFNSVTNEKCGEVKLEVQSVKTSYRRDYRYMLEEITEHCTDLLLQQSSPVSQLFETDFNADAKTIYQRFAFIKSVLDTEEFNDAVNKIISAPVTKWKEIETIKDIRSVRRINNASLRQISGATNRIILPANHPLKETLDSIPARLRINNKTETVDSPENRFVKHALVSFQTFCSNLLNTPNDNNRLKLEAKLLEGKLEQYLSHSIFKEIAVPTTLPLNSPVLQRKEGYREVLRVWLMFDLAAKLVWHGGDDVYNGNKRDVAVLYEYWLFFKLLDIIKEVFKIEPKNINELIKETADGLGLQLKQGVHLPVKGIYASKSRKLEIEFSYNKTFSGRNVYPDGGSWTQSMRPDYTLSIWPYGIDAKTAEREELIVHIHFDAKYKVEKLSEILGDDLTFESDKYEQRKGTYKRADLLKMHTYKDAIRRTAGAYVLYPGTVEKYTKVGFHELIPGLGAFAIRPSKLYSGSAELKKFLQEVVVHFMNRASQREISSLSTYKTYKNNTPNEMNEALPESYGINRNLLPDETFVLVGYSTKPERFNWYVENKKYIFRMDETKGSLELNNDVVNAKYLLLRTNGKETAGDLFKIISKGPKVFSVLQLDKLNYPPSKNPKEYYLAIEIEKVTDREFENVRWNFKAMNKYKSVVESERNPYTKAGLPFTVTLTELMQVVVK